MKAALTKLLCAPAMPCIVGGARAGVYGIQQLSNYTKCRPLCCLHLQLGVTRTPAPSGAALQPAAVPASSQAASSAAVPASQTAATKAGGRSGATVVSASDLAQGEATASAAAKIHWHGLAQGQYHQQHIKYRCLASMEEHTCRADAECRMFCTSLARANTAAVSGELVWACTSSQAQQPCVRQVN